MRYLSIIVCAVFIASCGGASSPVSPDGDLTTATSYGPPPAETATVTPAPTTPKTPGQLTWQIKDGCDDKLPMYLNFYGTLSGFSPAYQAVIWQPNQYQSMTVTCKSADETICLGADSGNTYWGVGPKGDKSCDWECCFPCDGSTQKLNLTCD